jgi:hypothetical protein
MQAPTALRYNLSRSVLLSALGLGLLCALCLFHQIDVRTLRFAIGGSIAARAAYLLLGPGMAAALELFSAWLSPQS